jgi:hypothetical protein
MSKCPGPTAAPRRQRQRRQSSRPVTKTTRPGGTVQAQPQPSGRLSSVKTGLVSRSP